MWECGRLGWGIDLGWGVLGLWEVRVGGGFGLFGLRVGFVR